MWPIIVQVLAPGLCAGLVAWGASLAERRYMRQELARQGRRIGRVERRVGITPEVR